MRRARRAPIVPSPRSSGAYQALRALVTKSKTKREKSELDRGTRLLPAVYFFFFFLAFLRDDTRDEPLLLVLLLVLLPLVLLLA